MTAKSVVLLLMVCMAGLLDNTAAQGGPCPASCDASKLTPVNSTGASTTDVMNAVKVTLDNILGAIQDVPEIGQLASGAKNLMDTGYSLWTAWNSVADPQPSIKNSLHNDLVKLQDYLVCEMTSIVSQAESDIIKDISDTTLQQFNTNFDAIVTKMNEGCLALNCLTVTNLPPSQRNGNVTYGDCVKDWGSPPECLNVKTWNASEVTRCTPNNNGAQYMSGICDTDGKCYTAGVSFVGAQEQMQTYITDLKGLYSLDGLANNFPISDMAVTVLGAKMSLLEINLYQQRIMLGASSGDNGSMVSAAADAAKWLQARYDYQTDINRIRALVGNYSTITNGTARDGGVNPAMAGSITNLGENTATCGARGDGVYQANWPCVVWNPFYGSYQLGWGCASGQTLPAYQQTEDFCYWRTLYDPNAPKPPCSHDTLPWGFTDSTMTVPQGVCTDFTLGQGKCFWDKDFPQTWMNQHNQWLQGNYTNAKEQLAQQLLANVTAALKDVKGTIDNLNKLVQVGMPAYSLGIFATSYPLQQCNVKSQSLNSVSSGATASPGNALIGDGAMPLPPGAVLVKPAAGAPTATSTTGNRKLRL